MSITEKKSAKGTPFAIIKFSDNKSEFELFLFSEILVLNREKLKESSSFILTLQKEKANTDSNTRRINVRKIIDLNDLVNKTYEQVSIEIGSVDNLPEIKNLLNKPGSTEIKIIVANEEDKYSFKLDKNRQFDFNSFGLLKSKEFVRKIDF